MDYREKVLYLLLKHNQDSKELKTSINELKKQLDDSNNQISIMSKALNVPEFVDLDLPSGNKWMKCNIGAKKETDYGLYFQFGDTVGYSAEDMRTRATWENCPGNNGNESANEESLAAWDEKHLTNLILNLDVNAAYMCTKGVATLPSEAQWRELISALDHEFVTNFNGSGINGIKCMSKKDNSKYIFIPASGTISKGGVWDRGAYCCLWRKYRYKKDILKGNAFTIRFSDNQMYPSVHDRYEGLCVRGVSV